MLHPAQLHCVPLCFAGDQLIYSSRVLQSVMPPQVQHDWRTFPLEEHRDSLDASSNAAGGVVVSFFEWVQNLQNFR